MNRRSFLGMLVGGLATAAAVRTFPFRVFSFPSEIKSPSVPPKELLELWKQRLKIVSMLGPSAPADWYMHPLQLQRLKELGYVDYAISGDIREVHPDQGLLPLGSSPSITVTGISVRESRYMDPRTPPVLLPRLPRTYRFFR
jgi:hypothetical protein